MEQNQTRRQFLQAAGIGAAVSLGTTAGTFGQAGSKTPLRRKGLPAARPVRRIPKRQFELGMASYTLRKFSLDDALTMTRRVGLTNIALKSMHLPLDSSPEHIRAVAAKVKDAGLNLYGCGVVYMKDAGQVDQAFAYAKAAGMKTIIGVPAPELLGLVDRKVKEYDIRVAIHNHGPGDKVYPTPASIIDRIRTLDGRIGLCMDIGHTVRIGEDPVRDAVRYATRLLDVHIKDVSSADAKGRGVEIGRGVIDIPGFIRTLIRTGYKGYVSFEYEKDAGDPLAGLAESVGYVKGVLAAVESLPVPRPVPAIRTAPVKK